MAYSKDLSSPAPQHIYQKHWEELIDAGISPEIASINFHSYDDFKVVNKLLNINWSAGNHTNILPGWGVQGVLPQTGGKTLAGAQYKPDSPRPQKNTKGVIKPGKFRKYESRTGEEASPLFLDPGISGYWSQVLETVSTPLFITEGAKKAGAGLTAGYAVISIAGVTTGQKQGVLKDGIKSFCIPGRTIYLCFDNDSRTNKMVCQALNVLGGLIVHAGAEVKIINLPEGKAKGLDDFLCLFGKQAFDKLISQALGYEAWRESMNLTVEDLSLVDRVKEILLRDLSPAEEQGALTELATATKSSVSSLTQIAEKLEDEDDLLEGRAARQKELQRLEKVESRKLTIDKYLHKGLADPITVIASRARIPAEALLTVFIPTLASCLQVGSLVDINPLQLHEEALVFHTSIVTPSGNRKSPALKIITQPLAEIQDEAELEYEAKKKAYKSELSAWNRSKGQDKGDEPTEPIPKTKIATDFTLESIVKACKENDGDGILILKDELSGLFGSFGAYKGGLGDDKEKILESWNGSGISKIRSSGERYHISKTGISITGAIQPETLRTAMGNFEDAQGSWARFLFYAYPNSAGKQCREGAVIDIGGRLRWLYEKAAKVRKTRYKLSQDAQKAYDPWYEKKELRRENPKTPPGLGAALAKISGYGGRLAGLLHIQEELMSGRFTENADGSLFISDKISGETMQAAIKLADFYLGQIELVHSDGAAAQGDVGAIMKQVMDRCKSYGTLSAGQAKSSIRGLKDDKKATPDRIRAMFRELVAMGFGVIEGEGKSAKLSFVAGVEDVATLPDAAKEYAFEPVSIEVNEFVAPEPAKVPAALATPKLTVVPPKVVEAVVPVVVEPVKEPDLFAPPAPKPTEEEKQGFKEGDTVRLAADHLSQKEQAAIISDNDFQIGAVVKIERILLHPLLLTERIRLPVAVVIDAEGKLWNDIEVTCLRRLE